MGHGEYFKSLQSDVDYIDFILYLFYFDQDF